MSRPKIFIVGFAAVVSLFLYFLFGGSTTPAGQQPLVRLNSSNVSSLKDAFNESANSVRILILASPT
jgi:hypothetical protein